MYVYKQGWPASVLQTAYHALRHLYPSECYTAYPTLQALLQRTPTKPKPQRRARRQRDNKGGLRAISDILASVGEP